MTTLYPPNGNVSGEPFLSVTETTPEAAFVQALEGGITPQLNLASSRIQEEHVGGTDIIRFANDEATPQQHLEELRQLNDQRNFAVFRARHVERLRDQLRALQKTIDDEAFEASTLQREEEQNADWMWDVQKNYAELEREMAEMDSRKIELKKTVTELDEERKVAENALKKEQVYVAELQLTETRNQLEIQKLNDFYHKYYAEKEQTCIDAKIVDTGIARQRKDLMLTKLRKRHLDFEVYRMQRQITAAEERMELRDAVKKQNLDELKKLKQQKLELEGELEILHQQNQKIARSLTSDMRLLEDNNDAGAKLAADVKECMDIYQSIVTETNGYKKEIKVLQIKHEQLTHAAMRTARDLVSYEKKMETYQVEMDALHEQLGRTSRLANGLSEQAEALHRYQMQKQFDLQIMRDHLSKEIRKKQDADVAFHEALMENKSFLKAARFSKQEYERLSEQLHQIEEDIGQQDYEITLQAIYRIEATNELEARVGEIEQITKDVKEKELQLKDAAAALEKESAAIDRRQDKINRLTNKLDSLIVAAGGEEISPIEAEISALRTAIQDGEEQFRRLKQDWLRYQTSIVKLTETRDELHARATDFDNQAFIATYKVNRLNKEIKEIEAECSEYIKTDKLIQENIARASEQLFKFNQKEQELVMKTLDMEHSSVANLRSEEVCLQEDKENLEKAMVTLKTLEEEIYDTKECSLMWERRLELKKQARKAIEQDFNKDELEGLRNEVHKLQLDKQTLEKEQLKVTQEMLSAAERRDLLYTQARRRVMEGEGPSLKKIQQIMDRKTKDLAALRKELKAIQGVEEDSRKRLDVFQKDVGDKTNIVNDLENAWKKVVDQKTEGLKQRFQVRLDNFVAQQYGKHYLAIKDGKYANKKLKTRDPAEMEQTVETAKRRYEDLRKIILVAGEKNPGIFEDRKSQLAAARNESSRKLS
ncbi:hypothetical protein BV898_13079 [Hypsibius exemplaris]|uniref:Coiled-coil domain-containing protein 40 n=1 Tax=Hypsibius exemplaris TaxID=2072580 RepID=A0A1W0WBW8_HYPEX|nr:hypothetical protein BV898_13079 [Hypsibius exemplaris]